MLEMSALVLTSATAPLMRRSVCVLGGGIGGLSAVHFIKQRARKAVSVRLIEASPRLGGCVSTANCEGFQFEGGPRSLRVTETSVATLRLVRELDLEKHMIAGPPLKGLIYKNGKVGPFESHLSFKTALALVGRLVREPFIPRTKRDDETIYDWGMRRLGPYVTANGLDPMISGIYAGNIKDLSMRSCLTRFWDYEQGAGSLVRGVFKSRREAKRAAKQIAMSSAEDTGEAIEPGRTPLEKALAPFQDMPIHPGGVFSFKGGLSVLTDALGKNLAKDEIILKRKVTGLRFRSTGAAVELDDGSVLECDTIVSALPNHVLAPLMQSHNERLGDLLGQVKSASLAVVNFGWSKQFPLPDAFGYLIPTAEKLDALGVVFDSATFPAQNPGRTVLTVMLGGEHNKNLVHLEEPEIAAKALQHVVYHTSVMPDITNIAVWKNAIPQYTIGHHARISAIEDILRTSFPQLYLTGSGLYGVGVNDCTTRSWNVANMMFRRERGGRREDRVKIKTQKEQTEKVEEKAEKLQENK